MTLNKYSKLILCDNNTACGRYQTFIMEGRHFFPECPECKMGLHSKSQSRACKTQNKELMFSSMYLEHYYGKWKSIVMRLLC